MSAKLMSYNVVIRLHDCNYMQRYNELRLLEWVDLDNDIVIHDTLRIATLERYLKTLLFVEGK